jgi:hypothetical protein
MGHPLVLLVFVGGLPRRAIHGARKDRGAIEPQLLESAVAIGGFNVRNSLLAGNSKETVVDAFGVGIISRNHPYIVNARRKGKE